MSFEGIKFLSGWFRLDDRSVVMEGLKIVLEIDNTGGDFLLMEYAYPGREEERGVSVTVKVFDKTAGHFRGFYSFPFYIGFKIPPCHREKLLVTLEVDQTYTRRGPDGKTKEHGLVLFHLELLNRQTDRSRYEIFEKKVENLKQHFLGLLDPSRQAQPLPMALLIEPTSRCNMDCVMCARSLPGHRKEEECDLSDELVSLLGRGMEGIQGCRIQGLGEPLISRNFLPLMDLLEANRVHVVTFNTNGTMLTEKIARSLVEKGKTFEHFRVSFSLDAATQETYSKIRNGNLDRTLKNIRFLQEFKKKMRASNPSVFINMTLSRTNIKDLPKFIGLASDLDAQVELNNLALDKGYESIEVSRGQQYAFHYIEEVLSAYPKLYNQCLRKAEALAKKRNVVIHKAGDVAPMDIPESRMRFLSRLAEILRRPLRSGMAAKSDLKLLRQPGDKDPTFERLPLCLLPWTQMVISSRGDISLCCVQGQIDHLRNHDSLEEAWNSENICRIREMLKNRTFPPECQTADCTVRKWNTRVCIVHQ